jgi:hydrogenase maturation protease
VYRQIGEDVMTLDNNTRTKAPTCWVLAYGNPQRGDDGIGPFVGEKLRRHFGNDEAVGICTLPHLDMTLLAEVQEADYLIFVDACKTEKCKRNRNHNRSRNLKWSIVEPELNGWAIGSHHLAPSVFLGLLQLLYERRPMAWMVAVPGYRFGFQERLSLEARSGAERAAAQIVDWLWIHRIIERSM